MAKRGSTAPQGRRKAMPGGASNKKLNAQSRRVMTQHYRAKYGVK
jgi:hypothetical protein